MSESVNTGVSSEVSSAAESVDTSVEASENSEVNAEESEQQEVDAAKPPKQEVKKSNKKKLKLKVDGQEVEEEIDLDDEETLKKHLQMSKAAMKRMQEAAKAKQEADRFMQRLKANPIEVLNDPSLGVDFREVAEQYLYEQIQRESMSPEEIEYQEKMKRLEDYEKKEKDSQEKEKEQRIAQARDYYAKQYDQKITTALQTSGLPKTAATVKRMAQMLQKNLELGLELEPEDLVQEVKNSYLQEFKEMLGDASAEQLISLFGDQIANKIRKYDVSKLQSNLMQSNPKPKEERVSAPTSGKKDYMTPDEYRAWLDSRLKD